MDKINLVLIQASLLFGGIPQDEINGGATNNTTNNTGNGGGGANTSDCSDHQITNIIKCDPTGDGSVWNLLATVVNFLAVGVGVVVLLGIIFGAFLYATSGGSADQAKRGIGYVRNAIIALLLFVFMYAIINFIIPGGLL